MAERIEESSRAGRGRRKRIGDILIAAKLITPKQMKEALRNQSISGERLGKILVDMGFLSEKDLARALSKQLGFPRIDLDKAEIPEETHSLLSLNYMI